MDITITINNQDLIDVLTEVATANNMTEQQYANGIVNSWLRNHLRNTYIGYTRLANLSTLKTKIGDYKQIKTIKGV